MSFPNPDWMRPDHEHFYFPVDGKPGIYAARNTHDCEVEITPLYCADCGPSSARIVYHSVCGCDDHRPEHEEADAQRRKEHGTCGGCGRQLDTAPVVDGIVAWPHLYEVREVEVPDEEAPNDEAT